MKPDSHNEPFSIGQPVWIKSGQFHREDHRTYIIVGFSRGFLGSMMAEIVPEDRLNTSLDFIPVKYLTDQMPKSLTPHPEHPGTIHWTATGRIIKCITTGTK